MPIFRVCLRCGWIVSLRPAIPALLLLLSSPSHAARWFLESGIAVGATFTDNANFQSREERESDVILDLAPSVVVRGEGSRFRLSAAARLSAVAYANGSTKSGATPSGRLDANVEAVERWFFIDAGLTSTQSIENPLAPRPDGPSTFNRLTTNQARLSPYVERELPNDIRLLLRSDNTWTQTRGAPTGTENGYSARHSARIEQVPRPFGWALEAERTETDFDGTTTPTPDVDTARLRLRYAIGGQWVVGARYGYERSDLFVETGSRRSFAGAELTWQPTGRTRLEGFWEDRVFGAGWRANFSHRMPRLAWNLFASRDLSSSAEPLLTLPATGDLAGLIDAAFRTRIPDSIERARAVEDFIARRGLPRTLEGASVVFTERILLRTVQSATVTWIGGRSTVALTGFAQRDEVPAGADFVPLPDPVRAGLSQRGAGITASHRLSYRDTLVGGLAWTHTRDLSSTLSGQSRQLSYRLQYDRQLGPKTSAFGGARHQVFDSDVVNDSRETALFVGLAHRF